MNKYTIIFSMSIVYVHSWTIIRKRYSMNCIGEIDSFLPCTKFKEHHVCSFSSS